MRILSEVVLSALLILVSLCLYCSSTIIEPINIKSSLETIEAESYKVSNIDTTIDVIDRMIVKLFNGERLRGGASIAVSVDGRIVYAKGIGYSDIEDSIVMCPYNLLRVASVSKLITSIAVMRLVEQGRIGLHQHVFGQTGILNDDKYLAYKDKRMSDVTVYELLNHSGGWTSRYGDPMFMSQTIAKEMGKKLPINMEDIIRFMQTKSMHFNPGSGSAYSNFGYGILGEIIAKVTCMPYEEYVKSEVLAPLGIFDMKIGHSHFAKRFNNEVKYYESDTSYVAIDFDTGEPVRRAYGGSDIQTLGSAGGWVASSVDLLKLVLTIDQFDNIPDQLSSLSIDTMTHHDVRFDPLGWRMTIDDSWYRSGTLAATSAMIARHSNGICYVVIFNCSNYRGPELANIIRRSMDIAVNNVVNWPKNDLLEGDIHWKLWKDKNVVH